MADPHPGLPVKSRDTKKEEQERNKLAHHHIPILHLHINHGWKIFRVEGDSTSAMNSADPKWCSITPIFTAPGWLKTNDPGQFSEERSEQVRLRFRCLS